MIFAGQIAIVAEPMSAETAMVRLEEDDALAVLCHRLRTPLTAAMGFIQLALREARTHPEDDSQLGMLEMVDQQLRRMSSMIDQVAEEVNV